MHTPHAITHCGMDELTLREEAFQVKKPQSSYVLCIGFMKIMTTKLATKNLH